MVLNGKRIKAEKLLNLMNEADSNEVIKAILAYEVGGSIESTKELYEYFMNDDTKHTFLSSDLYRMNLKYLEKMMEVN